MKKYFFYLGACHQLATEPIFSPLRLGVSVVRIPFLKNEQN